MPASLTAPQLGWEPVFAADEAVSELLDGIERSAGAATAPLAPG